MARPRKPSDDVYNARRRLQRQAARIEKNAQKIKNDLLREASMSYAKSLRETAAAARGKDFYKEYNAMSKEQREERLNRLEEVRKRAYDAAYSRSAVVRANEIFKQQINAAGVDGGESTLNKNAAKAFWVANKGLWTDGGYVPRNERYERILSEWYGDTSNARKLSDWLVAKRANELGRPLTESERKQLLAESFNNLQLVYEFIAEQLEQNEAGLTDLPELDYERVKKAVYVAH